MDLEYFKELSTKRFNNFNELRSKESKIMTLHGAIKKYIKPNQFIHIGLCGGGFSSAAVHEIIRQYYDNEPNFKLAIIGATTLGQYMLGANLETPMIQQLITTFAADSYPRTMTVPIFNHHLKRGMKMEYWSLLSYNLALLAGAMRVPFLPTNSLLNSSMEKENEHSFCRITNPFGQGETENNIGIVKAINPDVSIYHAWAADPYGNSLFSPPYEEDVFGAYACKGPVIITAERIVDTEFIKQHRNFVKIPGHKVSCVIEASYGAHPSMYYGLNGGYIEDLEFLLHYNKQNRTPEGLNKFVKEWIIGTNDFEGYKENVGLKKLKDLSNKLTPSSWIDDITQRIEDIKTLEEKPPNSLEVMTLYAAEIIADKIIQNNYDIVLAGQGYSNLSAWLARYILAKKNKYTNLVAEVGFYGYLPRPGNPFIFNVLNIPTCDMASNIIDIVGINLGCSNSCAVLGAAQIDKFGNINSSKVGTHHLVGSGGANDCGSPGRVKEIFVVCQHNRKQMIEKVPYITVPGNNISTVITTRGILKKNEKNKALVLVEYFNPLNKKKGNIIENIKENTGWDLEISDKIKERKGISSEELAMLRLFDPHHFFLKA